MLPPEVDRTRRLWLAVCAFSITLGVYWASIGPCVGLDDAPELAYCATEWSVAHPPGFPAWTALAHTWTRLLGFLDYVVALSLFSAVCSSLAVALLFVATERIVRRLTGDGVSVKRVQWAAFAAAVSAGFGTTVWQWSNAVEVYALQLLAVVMILLAVTFDLRRWPASALAGVGLGVGGSNHNLTVALFVPFALLLARRFGRVSTWREARRPMLRVAAIALAVFVAFHVAMVVRATADYRFEFGSPDSLARFWHHVTGGFLRGSFMREDSDPSARALYYLILVARHFWLLAIPAAYGMWVAWRDHRGFAIAISGYLVAVIGMSLFRRHVPNMDSYAIPALGVASVLAGYGLALLGRAKVWVIGVAAAIVLQVAASWSACSRAGYDSGDAVIADFDSSTPRGSIVLVTNWAQRMLYELYRARVGFREDLIVVHSALKGTNHTNLRVAYPEFFAAVRPEYEAFLDAVAAVDPNYVFTDYYEINTPALDATFRAMIARVIAVGREQGRAVLMDRQTAAFLLSMRVIDGGSIHPHGNLLAIGVVPGGPPFTTSGSWLDHPFLMHDLCAIAVLDNYTVSAQQIAKFYERTNDPRFAATEAAANRLTELRARWQVGKPLPPKRSSR